MNIDSSNVSERDNHLPDKNDWQYLLSEFQSISHDFLNKLESKSVATLSPELAASGLSEKGEGMTELLNTLKSALLPQMSASRGPRYWGFVTGGSTPVATFADWMVSLLDQNVAKGGDSIATQIERQTIEWLVELFDLPSSFTGLFTTGATASNFLAAVTARQFAGQQQDIDVAKAGMRALDVEVFSACPHASMIKTLGLAGFGQHNIVWVNTEANSEKMDTQDLAHRLETSSAKSKIVISSAATVTGTSFDDLQHIAEVCQEHKAWLHVDAAFGIFERLLSYETSDGDYVSAGLELADSITLDGHKWLNVPYDSGIFLTRHQELLFQSCHVAAPYLVNSGNGPDYMSLGIENSRRFRAFPTWMTLFSYGREGVAWWVKKNREQAQQLASYIDKSVGYQLVYPCDLNVVLFKPAGKTDCAEVLRQINQTGRLFLSPGKWDGEDIMRAAICNWQTEQTDIDIAINVLEEVAATLS